jgi:Tfp pilus assembly protein FimT
MLEECLVYIAVWAVLTGLAFAAFFRVWDNAVRLRRSTEGIAHVLQVGERWRLDVRQAIGPIRLDAGDGESGQVLHLPQQSGETAYAFTGTNILRRSHGSKIWAQALADVKSSRMIEDKRDGVTGWRWELELRSRKKEHVIRPLFTFQAATRTELR